MMICRVCQEAIDPGNAVLVHHELGNSGPGWDVYACREHVDDVEIIDPVVLDLMLRLWAAGS